MSILFRQRPDEPVAEARDWRVFAGGALSGWAQMDDGVAQGVDSALKNAASWACIQVMADAIARTPFNGVRTDQAGKIMDPQPILLSRPSGIVQLDVWKSQLGFALNTDGNAFGQIISFTAGGYPQQVEWLDPSKLPERDVVNGVPRVKVNAQWRDLYPRGDIFHIPGRLVMPGSPFGLSPITYAAKTIGTTLKAEEFSFDYFASGAHPTMDVIVNQQIDDIQAEAMSARISRAAQKRKPIVHGNMYELKPWGVDQNETEFLSVQEFAVLQACRFWQVPPSMVYAAISGQHVTYANVTQADLHWLKHSLDGLLSRLEFAFTAALPRPQAAVADRDAILKASPIEMQQLWQLKLANNLGSVNEGRDALGLARWPDEKYDMPGVPGGLAAPSPPAPINAPTSGAPA